MEENTENQAEEKQNIGGSTDKKIDDVKRTRQIRDTKYPLPDARMTIDRQIKVMKALNIATSKGKTLVTYQDVAPLAGMHPTLVSGALGFFQKINLIKKEGSKYVPLQDMMDFCNELEWNEQGAGEFFRKLILKTWFGEYTLKLFRLHHEMKKEDLIASIGKEAQADKYHHTAILKIVDFLEYSKIIEFDETSNKYKLSDFNLPQEDAITQENEIKPTLEPRRESDTPIMPPKGKGEFESRDTHQPTIRGNGFVINVNITINEETDTEVLAKKISELKKNLGNLKND